MFGYIRVFEKELKIREYELYRSYYCGLCHALKKQYGRTGQLLLNYDMTFLLLLLEGLYEPEEQTWSARCIPHPLIPHPRRSSALTQYAADMTVLLAREKARDDWQDEHSLRALALLCRLRRPAARCARRWPRQAKALRENIGALQTAQNRRETDIDRMCAYTGRFLAELFVKEEDAWSRLLRQMGFYLGKFIYLADAWEDREKDRKSGSYNLFLELERRGETMDETKVREMLTDFMAHCCSALEQLPPLANEAILRNILYAGVWTGTGTGRGTGGSKGWREPIRDLPRQRK